MWDTVLLMAVAACLGPQRIGAVVVIVSRTHAVRMLLAFLASSFGLTLAIGGAVLFLVGVGQSHAGVGQSHAVFSWLRIVGGLLALVFAVSVATGLATRVVALRHSRREGQHASEAGGPPSSAMGHESNQLPGFDRMPRRVQAALRSDSPWIGGLVGVLVGVPTFYLLAALTSVFDADVGRPIQVAALVVFCFLAFLQTLVPLVGFLAAPGATRTGLNRLYAWLSAHNRLVVATLATVVGVHLVIKGISAL